MLPVLAVAALSARSLAEAAAASGRAVLALDLFGDVDTQRAARQWWPIGEPASMQIQAEPLCSALRRAALHGAIGWVAGSGFEQAPELLDLGAAVLPLIGNRASVLRRLQDPVQFFACLDRHGVPHPAVRRRPPADGAEGWLLKDSAGCGGWRVRPAAMTTSTTTTATGASTVYHQRVMPGAPVSVTFVANGVEAVVLGFNEQRTQAIGGQPYVFAGVVGPVRLPAAAARDLRRALAVLVAEFGLRGLGSLDALLDGDRISVLELNPRPPASLALYPSCAGVPLIDVHLAACLYGQLPPHPDESADAARPRGHAVVYARQALEISSAAAVQLAAWPHLHDVPQPGTRVGAGEPLCCLSVPAHPSSQALSPASVHARLDHHIEHLLHTLENTPP